MCALIESILQESEIVEVVGIHKKRETTTPIKTSVFSKMVPWVREQIDSGPTEGENPVESLMMEWTKIVPTRHKTVSTNFTRVRFC